MNIEEKDNASENAPRPFSEIPGLWLQLSRMSEDFFSKEIAHASAKNTLLSVLLYTGISATISVLITLLSSAINYFSKTPSQQLANIGTAVLFSCCYAIIAIPLGFYLSNGITFVIALIFGGKGKFVSQAYLGSLFVVPLGLISSITSFALLIPIIGNYVLYVLLFVILIFNHFDIIQSLGFSA